MKNEQLYREVFIGNTIRLVAEGGFEKATTRAIAHSRGNVGNVKMNEVHIYRIFESKDNLFAEVFKLLDSELVYVIQNNLSVFDSKKEFKEQCRDLFTIVWRFPLANEEKCRYYTRFYYSAYLTARVQAEHQERHQRLIEKMSPAFKPDADVQALLAHCIATMLNFAVRVYNGALEDREDNAYHIFVVVYSAIEPYLK